MTKWEKWIKEYGKRNYKNVLEIVLNSTQGISRFVQANKRAQNALKDGKRFYLKNEEKLDLISEWMGKPMSLNRALALAWTCNCSLSCFKWHAYGKELILTHDGYYVTRGCFYVFINNNQEKEEGILGGVTLQEYLEASKGYKEDELWKLR